MRNFTAYLILLALLFRLLGVAPSAQPYDPYPPPPYPPPHITATGVPQMTSTATEILPTGSYSDPDRGSTQPAPTTSVTGEASLCVGENCPETATPSPQPPKKTAPPTQPPTSTTRPPTATENTPTSPPDFTNTPTPWPPDKNTPTPIPSVTPTQPTQIITPHTPSVTPPYPPPVTQTPVTPDDEPTPTALPGTGFGMQDGFDVVDLIALAIACVIVIGIVRLSRRVFKI